MYFSWSREILKADAALVDLHTLSPYFYELGQHLLPLAGPEGATLGVTLVEVSLLSLSTIISTMQKTAILFYLFFCYKWGFLLSFLLSHICLYFTGTVCILSPLTSKYYTVQNIKPRCPVYTVWNWQTLRERLRGIMDTSLNTPEDDAGARQTKLDQLERSLFLTGRKTFRDHQLWLSRRAHIVTTSHMVTQHNKRKFSEVSWKCKERIIRSINYIVKIEWDNF